VQSLFHSKEEEQVKEYMGVEGGFRTWVGEGMMAEKPGYLSEQVRCTQALQLPYWQLLILIRTSNTTEAYWPQRKAVTGRP